ncbi:hypothetical protein AC579_3368 [Pseudocercospora musae]|uniref:Uncharacterized protein n=1 Tax=Pseudocercospora musae TaxID=113226 RepID=A0A139GTM9_9PEZI|nr:hypothetical protein AC579_3368 [Pseudocercospora musae]
MSPQPQKRSLKSRVNNATWLAYSLVSEQAMATSALYEDAFTYAGSGSGSNSDSLLQDDIRMILPAAGTIAVVAQLPAGQYAGFHKR